MKKGIYFVLVAVLACIIVLCVPEKNKIVSSRFTGQVIRVIRSFYTTPIPTDYIVHIKHEDRCDWNGYPQGDLWVRDISGQIQWQITKNECISFSDLSSWSADRSRVLVAKLAPDQTQNKLINIITGKVTDLRPTDKSTILIWIDGNTLATATANQSEIVVKSLNGVSKKILAYPDFDIVDNTKNLFAIFNQNNVIFRYLELDKRTFESKETFYIGNLDKVGLHDFGTAPESYYWAGDNLYYSISENSTRVLYKFNFVSFEKIPLYEHGEPLTIIGVDEDKQLLFGTIKKANENQVVTAVVAIDLKSKTMTQLPIILGDRPYSGIASDGTKILYDSYLVSTSGNNFDQAIKEELCFRDEYCGLFYNQNLNKGKSLMIK